MKKAKMIPYPFTWDDAPLDLSFIYKQERPAGKHGFLTVQGDKMIFEDGTETRFWGTNFNSGACFPSHEHSEKVARRLAKFGINMVRFHQMDAEWSTPNIFQFAKGERLDNTLELDPESMERLDYLIYCLKQNGIYIYMDLLTYRKFKSGDGVAEAERLDQGGRPYSNYSRKLIDLQKRFNEQVWNHFNPYTKLAYKDDPAIALTEIVNENEMFWYERSPITLEPYRSELVSMYRKFQSERGGEQAAIEADPDFASDESGMVDFLYEVHVSYYKEMMEHMRSIGVKIPITGTNYPVNAALLKAHLITDFTDSHSYWWIGDQSKIRNDMMTSHTHGMMPRLVISRVPDKPFFVSEWDSPWPNEWRAESTLYLAALGTFQGWSGFTIHTYRYGTLTNHDKIGRNIAIGGTYYRGTFDTYNDPAKFGLFYHAALLHRRGDVKQAEKRVHVKVEDMRFREGSLLRQMGLADEDTLIPAIELSAEKHRLAMELPGERHEADLSILPEESIVDPEMGEVLSDTGELYRSWEKKIGWIDTPRTKAVYGMVGDAGALTLRDVKIEARTDFATIAISSLTDAPISASDNMLLTAVGRADNTDCEYNEDHTVELKPGRAPMLIEVIEANVEIKTEQEHLKVWAINPEGFFAGVIPSQYKNGTLSFAIGNQFPSMYYLIQKQ